MAWEIERKFIIKIPDGIKGLPYKDIEQTYLVSDSGTRRVRCMKSGNVKECYFTEKHRQTDLACEEKERRISETEYREYLRLADPARKTVYKTRYYYKFEGQMFEIDVYPFWQKQCVMEIELPTEDTPVLFPPDIIIIKEVTSDPSYKNAALAKAVPAESI